MSSTFILNSFAKDSSFISSLAFAVSSFISSLAFAMSSFSCCELIDSFTMPSFSLVKCTMPSFSLVKEVIDFCSAGGENCAVCDLIASFELLSSMFEALILLIVS